MRRPGAWLAASLTALGGVCVHGCYDLAGYGDFQFAPPVHERLATVGAVTKLDLLLVVDNSKQLGEAQEALRVTLAAFITRLTNPPCLDANGNVEEVANALQECSTGFEREFPPLLDIHIGVVTSSLGSHGSAVCEDNSEQNGRAHLQPGMPDQTYEERGFLAWDPRELTPGSIGDVQELSDRLDNILGNIGDGGCGYEAPLEAWYRFLVQPDPHQQVEVDGNLAVLVGSDDLLLQQRAAFLRPDSMVAVVVLSEENDCSMIDGGPSFLFADPGLRLPKPRPECELTPLDPCCASCSQPTPDGCPPADECDGASLSIEEDHPNLRCFDQKRRFGFDALYAIDRYQAGLTASQVPDRNGSLVDNPMLLTRDPALVLFTAIVGVPWQDIARQRAKVNDDDDHGVPNLEDGLDASGARVGGIRNSAELEDTGVWDIILGDPASGLPPRDPFMHESRDPRSGTNEILEQQITTDPANPNIVNGFDFTSPDSLQFACVYDLPQPIPPSGMGLCDEAPVTPLCSGTDQVRGGATPGLRHLDLVSRLGAQGTVASACWEQLNEPEEPSYGYMAAFVGGIVDRIKVRLRGQPCLDVSLRVDGEGSAACTILEARTTTPGQCACDAPARRPPGDADKALVDVAKADPLNEGAGWNCFCFLNQAADATDRAACQSYVNEPVVSEFGQLVDAWCYVDQTTTPPIGAAEIVAGCAHGERRAIRLVGAARPKPESTLFLDCE